ncbi:MAG TPA: hypothetical protein VFS04_00655 [Alphaproteobacteria bacterium]|nr:hypothetical protein [Alphaproteobacteria bacterium]
MTHIYRICLYGFASLFLWGIPQAQAQEDMWDPPPPYIYPDYTPIDAEGQIKNCWDVSYLARSSTTADSIQGFNTTAGCLEAAIIAASRDMFDEDMLRKPDNDFPKMLADIRHSYWRLIDLTSQAHKGCFCGTIKATSADWAYAKLLEGILIHMAREQNDKPPRYDNPDYLEWESLGRPEGWMKSK